MDAWKWCNDYFPSEQKSNHAIESTNHFELDVSGSRELLRRSKKGGDKKKSLQGVNGVFLHFEIHAPIQLMADESGSKAEW